MPLIAAGFPTPSSVVAIETDRLWLRAHHADDHATCAAIWSDPAVVRYIGGRAFTAEEVWGRLLRYAGLWSLLGYGYWAIEEKRSGQYIGDIGYADFKRDITPSLVGMPELGWVLASRTHGQGYASEALAAVTHWGDANLDGRQSVCIIAPENLASLRVAAKAGFRPWCEASYHGSPTLIFAR
jgi:RimJ/RimL family protein N-acetyltransferase